jgi:hypothetical protein
MTTIIWEGIGGVVLFLAAAVLSIYFYGRLCRDAGYEDGRADAYLEIHPERAISGLPDPEPAGEREPGRHRMSQPRASAPSPAPAPAAAPSSGAPWYRYVAAAAASLDTVLLAPQPAPQLDGAADTGTMTRIHLDAGTTGEIRAVGDELVAKIERGELV